MSNQESVELFLGVSSLAILVVDSLVLDLPFQAFGVAVALLFAIILKNIVSLKCVQRTIGELKSK